MSYRATVVMNEPEPTAWAWVTAAKLSPFQTRILSPARSRASLAAAPVSMISGVDAKLTCLRRDGSRCIFPNKSS